MATPRPTVRGNAGESTRKMQSTWVPTPLWSSFSPNDNSLMRLV